MRTGGTAPSAKISFLKLQSANRKSLPLNAAPPFQEVIDERHEQQYEKDVEDRLRNTGRCGGDPAKSQDPGYNRDHEES